MIGPIARSLHRSPTFSTPGWLTSGAGPLGCAALLVASACSSAGADNSEQGRSTLAPGGSSEAAAGVGSDGSAGGSEGNPALGEQTPLAPSGLDLVEIPIPGDLPGCSPAYPHDPAVDLDTGVVYYAGSNESCIGQYDPETGRFQAWPTATASSYPHGLVVVGGAVYFTGNGADLIGRLDPTTGEAVDFPVAAGGPHTPVFHAGAIWFTAQSGDQFGRFDPATGESEVFPFAGSPTGPYGIWPAPDGSLWVALFATNRLARIDTGAAPPREEQVTLPATDARPRRVAVDASGKVWYTDYARSALGVFDPAAGDGGSFREFPTPGGGRPYGIAIGPDGRVWYNDENAAEIVGFAPASESVFARLPIEIENPGPVRNIAVDPARRRLWLAISNVGQLAVIQF